MNFLILSIGIFLVALVAYDLTYTTLAPKGAGQMTSRVSNVLWKISLKLSGYDGSTPFLSNLGYIFLYIILFIWVMLIWLGNTLIIYSDPSALLNSDKELVTSFLDKAYYTAYVLSTMGSGEFHPATPGWRVYAAFASYTGLIFITIAISYLIPVVSAVAEKRALANYIAGMGQNPYELLKNYYNGRDFKEMESHCQFLTSQILILNKNHQAYPALHYFHEDSFIDSTCIYICSLDETISILLCLPEEKRPSDHSILTLRHALTLFLHTLHGAYLNPTEEYPDSPDEEKLEELSSGLVNGENMQVFSDGLGKRRRIINAYLHHHGWTMKQMYGANYKMEFES